MAKLKLKKKSNPPEAPSYEEDIDESVEDPRLSEYINEWGELRKAIDRHMKSVEIFDKRVQELEIQLLPNLLREMGVELVKTPDGTSIAVKETYTASVSQRNMKEATKILKRIGAGDLMQVKVNFMFTAAEKAGLKQLLEFTKEHGVPCDTKNDIHAATLKKVVAEAMKAGKLQPEDLPPLGVFNITRAVIKLPKEE